MQIADIFVTKKQFKVFQIPCVIMLTNFVLGCASADVESVKADTYQREPKKLYIVLRNEHFSDEFESGFSSSFKASASDCGVESQVRFYDKLDLGNTNYYKAAKVWGAEAMLTIRPDGGTRQGTVLMLAKYDATLFDIDSNNKVWRAAIKLNTGGIYASNEDKGVALSEALIGKLKEDEVIRDCLPSE